MSNGKSNESCGPKVVGWHYRKRRESQVLSIRLRKGPRCLWLEVDEEARIVAGNALSAKEYEPRDYAVRY